MTLNVLHGRFADSIGISGGAYSCRIVYLYGAFAVVAGRSEENSIYHCY